MTDLALNALIITGLAMAIGCSLLMALVGLGYTLRAIDRLRDRAAGPDRRAHIIECEERYRSLEQAWRLPAREPRRHA